MIDYTPLGNVLSVLDSQVLSVVVYEQVSLSKYSPSATGPDTRLRQGGIQNMEMCSLIITVWFVLKYTLETSGERKTLLLVY